MKSKTASILLVEDNEGDIVLTKEAFEESRLPNRIDVVKNGKEATDFLYRRNGFEDAKVPDLILLDINMPIKNGHEVVTEIKSDENLKCIPIIILTTSSSKQDIDKAYKNHANCYIKKPLNIDEFIDTIGKIEDFWFNLVSLPQR